MKRGTDIPLLKSEVVRITLSADVVTSPRYTREPPHSLADFGSFSRFLLQVEHNASLFQQCRAKMALYAKLLCKDTHNSSRNLLLFIIRLLFRQILLKLRAR